MDTWIQVPLNWPAVRVLATQRTAHGHGLIRVESTREGPRCHRCRRERRDVPGWDAAVRRRPLPLCEVPVCVEIRPKRSRGPYGSGTPPPPPPCEGDEPRRPTTKAYAPGAWRRRLTSTVTDAARTLRVSAETSAGLLDRWMARPVDGGAWARRGVLGLDALARTRGHRDVVAWVTTPLAGGGVASLAVRGDRQQATVAAFLGAIPEARRDTLDRAGTAMDAGVVRARAEAVPWAEVVSARVHGARADRDGADTGRTQELPRRKSARPPAEDAESQGAMWPFRQRPVARTPQEWERRARVFTWSPTREEASHLRADLTARCARDETQAGATCAMRAWSTRVRVSGRAEVERVLGTSARWRDQITHDCQARQTSGVVEGFNHRVKVLTRRCDGIFDVGRLVQRLTLDRHGDQRFRHT